MKEFIKEIRSLTIADWIEVMEWVLVHPIVWSVSIFLICIIISEIL
jgi:hypothetical protein